MFLNQAKKILLAITSCVAIISIILSGQQAQAQTVTVDHGPLATELNFPVYQWQDDQRNPKAVVVAIHGLTMHGTVFDDFARKLAADGAVVIAPDLRGYGAWYKNGKNTRVNYKQSERDLCALITAVRERYRGLPLFLAGESLGGAMAIRLAAKNAEQVDGLILSAPAIELRYSAKTVVESLLSLATPGHEIDVSGYIKKNFSEDSQITEEGLTDPLIRKHLSAAALYESCRFISSTRHFIDKVPARIPVLVMQGEDDRIVKPRGVTVLESKLKSRDETFKLLPSRGHILIETQHIHQDDMNTILTWMDSECVLYTTQHANIATGQGVAEEGPQITGASSSNKADINETGSRS